MAADTVPGARGSLARTSVISQPAPRAPGPRLGALGGGGPRETSLSCPTKAGPRGNSGTGKQNHLCPQDTGKSGRCSAMAMEQVPSDLGSSESQPVSVY